MDNHNNSTTTYSVERQGINKFFETCLVSFPCGTKEDAIALAIKFSCKYGTAELFMVNNDTYQCTFFVGGKVQGTNNIGYVDADNQL